MSRNFELMTQLGLQVGVTDKPEPDMNQCAAALKAFPMQSADVGNVSEEEMARFIIEIFPRGGGAPKI